MTDSLGMGKIISGIFNSMENHQSVLGSARINISDTAIKVTCDKENGEFKLFLFSIRARLFKARLVLILD